MDIVRACRVVPIEREKKTTNKKHRMNSDVELLKLQQPRKK